jgi:hypothetical protein
MSRRLVFRVALSRETVAVSLRPLLSFAPLLPRVPGMNFRLRPSPPRGAEAHSPSETEYGDGVASFLSSVLRWEAKPSQHFPLVNASFQGVVRYNNRKNMRYVDT